MYAAGKRGSALRKAGDFIVKEIRENKSRLLMTVVVTAAFVLLGIFIFQRIQTLGVTASERLSYAYYYLGGGDVTKAVSYLDDAINNFSNTPASFQARLVRADIYLEEDDYDNALPLLSETVSKGKPQEIRPLALARIVNLYDRKGDYQTAAMYSNEFIGKYKAHYLIKDIYLNLARYYATLESSDDAKRVLNDILVTFPGTGEASAAEKMLDNIK